MNVRGSHSIPAGRVSVWKEAVVSGVVLLLPSEVPGHEGDAPEAGLTLTDSLLICLVTDY